MKTKIWRVHAEKLSEDVAEWIIGKYYTQVRDRPCADRGAIVGAIMRQISATFVVVDDLEEGGNMDPRR